MSVQLRLDAANAGEHLDLTCYSLTTEHLEDFAAMAGLELVIIDAKTELRSTCRRTTIILPH